MSDAISKLRKLGFGNDEQQQQQQAVQATQAAGGQLPSQTASVTSMSQLSSQPQPITSRLGLVPAGSPRFLSILNELDSLNEIERAIVASRLVMRDDPILELKPEDWVALIKERVGDVFADAFDKWLKARCKQ
jgi:hypothetical protein